VTASAAPAPTWRGTVSAYVALTKPRIIELLLVTTVPTMIVAEGGLPSVWLIAATLVGGALAAGSANTINSYLERDIDQLMHRTARRPLVEQQVSPRAALRFGVVLGVAAFALLASTVNLLAAALAIAAIGIYVFVYTLGLKRRSAQNIVIGGAAGCMPVLVGWAAVTGGVGLPALVLFAIVFAWTPSHFWALALRFREDYSRAGVPMLPVVASARDSAIQILLYTVLLVALTLMFGPVGGMGVIYLVAAVALGAVYIWQAVALLREPGGERALVLFRYSITYLGLLFAAMATDALLLG
jgi:heme o synthase